MSDLFNEIHGKMIELYNTLHEANVTIEDITIEQRDGFSAVIAQNDNFISLEIWEPDESKSIYIDCDPSDHNYYLSGDYFYQEVMRQFGNAEYAEALNELLNSCLFELKGLIGKHQTKKREFLAHFKIGMGF